MADINLTQHTAATKLNLSNDPYRKNFTPLENTPQLAARRKYHTRLQTHSRDEDRRTVDIAP